MRGVIEELYWRFMLRSRKVVRIRGMRFLYISADGNRPPAEICRSLFHALDRIALARSGFGELVMSHLSFVAALDAPREAALIFAKGYVSPFPDIEVTNTHYLACRLVWAATYIRLSRDHRAYGSGSAVQELDIRQAAYDAQVRFSAQFPDAEDWLAFLARHPEGV